MAAPASNLRINGERLWDSLMEMAKIGPGVKGGNRRLTVKHLVRNGQLLAKTDCERTLQCLANLWGHRVKLLEIDSETDELLVEHDALPRPR